MSYGIFSPAKAPSRAGKRPTASYGIFSTAKAQAKDEFRRERRRKKVNAHKAKLREKQADRDALKRELYRRIFGL